MIPTGAVLDFRASENVADRSIWFNGFRLTRRVSGEQTENRYALLEAFGTPGTEPPLHIHEREDEFFYVLDGELLVTRGEEQIRVLPGESVFLPRGVPHTFRIKPPSARALVLISPSGFEQFFWELGVPAPTDELPPDYQYPSMDRILEVSARVGIRYPATT